MNKDLTIRYTSACSRAQELITEKKYDEALSLLKSYDDGSFESNLVNMFMADVYVRLNDPINALTELHKNTEKKGNIDWLNLSCRARCKNMLGDYMDALSLIEQAIEKYKQNEMTMFGLSSDSDMKKTLEIQKIQKSRLFQTKGDALNGLNRLNEAKKAYNLATLYDEENLSASIGLADIEYKFRNYRRALDSARKIYRQSKHLSESETKRLDDIIKSSGFIINQSRVRDKSKSIVILENSNNEEELKKANEDKVQEFIEKHSSIDGILTKKTKDSDEEDLSIKLN